MIFEKLDKIDVSKSPGPDPRVLYEIRHEVIQPLHMLFNTSFSLARLPKDWKISKIVALHKKGNKNEPSNYRPVSLTSIVCKIMKSIIMINYVMIMNHFLATDYFSNKQYGFIKGRSTALQLLTILDDWTFNLDLGNQIDVIYTDFEKTFDKIPHHGLHL